MALVELPDYSLLEQAKIVDRRGKKKVPKGMEDVLDDPCPDEITTRTVSRGVFDRSFDTRGTFVHFAQHSIRIVKGAEYAGPESGRHAGANFLRNRGWYDSDTAVSIRRYMRTPRWMAASMCSLILALFAPDICVVLQVPGNWFQDTLVSLVFGFFLTELVMESVSLSQYPLSFSFWVDLFGTLSMLMDISFLLGDDNTVQVFTSTDANKSSLIKSVTAVRIGSRVARVSRVPKVLKLTYYFHKEKDAEESNGFKTAKAISSKLSSRLSMSVALIVGIIAVLMPSVMEAGSPEVDESMYAWTELIASDVKAVLGAMHAPKHAHTLEQAQQRLRRELLRLNTFYSSMWYGPFKVCRGRMESGTFRCQALPFLDELQTNLWSFGAPRRLDLIWEMSSDNVQVYYDVSYPKCLESCASMALIMSLIITMILFNAALNYKIQVLALVPMQRMTTAIHTRCAEIFRYTKELQPELEDTVNPHHQGEDVDDNEDEDAAQAGATEFMVLEKAIVKLATIAQLAAATHLPETQVVEEMNEETEMLLSFHGMQVHQAQERHRASSKTQTVPSKTKFDIVLTGKVPPEVEKNIWAPTFDAIALTEEQKGLLTAFIMSTSTGSASIMRNLVEQTVLLQFVKEAQKGYLPNPFHNYSHGLDVLQTCALSLSLIKAGRIMSEETQLWLLVAAIGHDLGHLGVNNQFLIETAHEVALTYNDRSPLENLHCSQLFQIIRDPAANIFAFMELEDYKSMRKGMIDAILHTDIVKHNEIIKELHYLSRIAMDEGARSGEASDVLTAHTQLMANALLHCADVGNPMKPWELCVKWSMLCLDEFFAQGDREKLAGVPVQMLNDREKVNRPNSQISFIEFMIVPMVEAIVEIMPQLSDLADRLGVNIRSWADKWIAEESPQADAKSKVEGRVSKVVGRCKAMTAETAEIGIMLHQAAGRHSTLSASMKPMAFRSRSN